ncbi:MAG: polymerase subunit delta, polymerase subunit delta protein [Parcubacteria group bacterium]|nr:polymerase subunit delta, polymerase subunit delta protein [Parcubacteria group bacterium]
MQQHAFVIEAEAEEGIEIAQAWIIKELDLKLENNPDVVVVRHGLLSVEDSRKVGDLANGAPFAGETKVVIVSASRAYHEAQNALLKLFEEPPQGTYLFLVMPSLGGLLPTLRSRVQELSHGESSRPRIPEIAEQFLKATKEKRSALIKKLTSGKDEDARRENREEAIALLNGIEAVAYKAKKRDSAAVALLSDIAILRTHLYDRSAPVKMILEHISLVIPRGLV